MKDEIAELETLKAQILEKEAKIRELDDEIKDMDIRLRNVFAWEDGKRKQEMLTLKKDIAGALKLRYDDYQALLNMKLSEDAYAFSKAIITQIFKVLKRYGIEL